MSAPSAPSSASRYRPSRRGFLAGLTCVCLPGRLGEHALLAPARAAAATKPIAKAAPPLRFNHPLQFGVDFSDPERAGEADTIFFASYRGKPVTDFSDFDERSLIPASMQKTASALIILMCCELPSIYRTVPTEGVPPQKLLSLTDKVTISEAEARLNGRLSKAHVHAAGAVYTLGALLEKALQESDNGAMQAAARYCGDRLIEGGYIKFPGRIAPGYRAFIDWANRQAQVPAADGGLGLSQQFEMLTPHGLPCYETLIDHAAFQRWTGPDKRRFGFFTADRHFRKRDADDAMQDIDRLPLESGIVRDIHRNNRWSWRDGIRIMALWHARYPHELAAWFPDKRGALSATGKLKERFRTVRAKTGTSSAAMACLHGIAEETSGRLIYALTGGQEFGRRKVSVRLGKGRRAKTVVREVKFDDRYKAFAEILNHCPAVVRPQPRAALQPQQIKALTV